MTTKQFLKRLFRRFGYDLQTLDYAREFTPALHLAEVFRRAEIKCVVDVGANTGQFRDFLRQVVDFDGWIVSFEPVPAHAMRLKARTATDPKWIVHDVAVGDEPGTLEINVMRHGVLSSFLEPLPDGREDMTITSRTAVTVVTLDSMIDTLRAVCPLRSTFLKIDTQGFDLRVIRGARRVLAELPAVQAEVSVKPIYEGMPGLTDVANELAAQGYEIAGLFPVGRDSLMCVIEFDGVFVHRDVLSR